MQGVFVVSMALVLLTGVIIWAASTNNTTKNKARRRKRARKRRANKSNRVTESAYVNSKREDPPKLPHNQAIIEPGGKHHDEHIDPNELHADTQHDVKGRTQISSLSRALTNLDGDAAFEEQVAPQPNGFHENFEILDKDGFNVQWSHSVNRNLSKADVTVTALSHRGLAPSSSAGDSEGPPSRLIGMSSDAYYKALKPTQPRSLKNAQDVPFGGSQFFSSLLAKQEKKA